MKGLGTNVRGNKCCKNICFSLLHLLHFIPPLHFGSFPILSSWFFSPPPVLFLPEEQHYPLLSLCTISLFFFPFAYCSAPRRFHTLLGSGCRSRAAAGLPSNVRVPSARPPPPSAPLHLLLPERRCCGGEQRRQEWERHEAAPSLAASGRRSLRAAPCCSTRSSCRAEWGVRTDGS